MASSSTSLNQNRPTLGSESPRVVGRRHNYGTEGALLNHSPAAAATGTGIISAGVSRTSIFPILSPTPISTSAPAATGTTRTSRSSAHRRGVSASSITATNFGIVVPGTSSTPGTPSKPKPHSGIIPITPRTPSTSSRTSGRSHTSVTSRTSCRSSSSHSSNASRDSFNTLTSRLTLRHGVPPEKMKLLADGPPESVFESMGLDSEDEAFESGDTNEEDGGEGGLSGSTTAGLSSAVGFGVAGLSLSSRPSTPTKSYHQPTSSPTSAMPTKSSPSSPSPSLSKGRSRPTSLSHPFSMSPPSPSRTTAHSRTISTSSLSMSTQRRSSPTPLTRHPDLWFPDGSVILRAESTLFCVHMSQLARHSLVFHDMFMLPQPKVQPQVDTEMLAADGGTGTDIEGDAEAADETTNITLVSASHSGSIPNPKTLSNKKRRPSTSSTTNSDGSRRVPVVQLYDKAQDVAILLTALYDGPSFSNNSPLDFIHTAGILRLSTKYLIDSLRAKALSHLELAWPRDLKGWEGREEGRWEWEMGGCSGEKELDPGKEAKDEKDGRETKRYPHPAAVIALAREVNAPSLLPSAFYDLSRYSFAQIFEHCGDGELRYIFSSSQTSSPYSPASSTSNHPDSVPERITPASLLSPQDIQRLCLGKEAAQQMITSLIQGMGSFRSSSYLYSGYSLGGTSSPFSSGPISTNPHPHPHPHPHRKLSSSTHLICTTPSLCRTEFLELIDLATQHYLFDREKGCSDPLYVAEELGGLKSVEISSSGYGSGYGGYASVGYNTNSGVNGGSTGMGGGNGGGIGQGAECKACGRQLEMWAAREKERIWKMVPGWFKLDGN